MTSSTSTFDLVKQAALSALKLKSPTRALEEGLISFDFGIRSERLSLMQICFSPLAGWFAILILIGLSLSPLRYQFSLSSLLGFESAMTFLLFKSDLQTQLIFFVAALALGTLIRWDFLVIGLIGFLLSNGDIHLTLAHSALWGVLFSQVRRQLKWLNPHQGALEPHLRSVIIWTSALQIGGFLIYAFASFSLFQLCSQLGFFNASMSANRMEFLILSLVLYYGIQFTVLSSWGHFYSKRETEPSKWNVKYSSVFLLPKFFLSKSFQEILEVRIRDLYQTRVQNKSDSKSIDQKPLSELDKNFETEQGKLLKVMPKRLLELNQRELENIALAQEMIK